VIEEAGGRFTDGAERPSFGVRICDRVEWPVPDEIVRGWRRKHGRLTGGKGPTWGQEATETRALHSKRCAVSAVLSRRAARVSADPQLHCPARPWRRLCACCRSARLRIAFLQGDTARCRCGADRCDPLSACRWSIAVERSVRKALWRCNPARSLRGTTPPALTSLDDLEGVIGLRRPNPNNDSKLNAMCA